MIQIKDFCKRCGHHTGSHTHFSRVTSCAEIVGKEPDGSSVYCTCKAFGKITFWDKLRVFFS